jgi:PKD repeat protein
MTCGNLCINTFTNELCGVVDSLSPITPATYLGNSAPEIESMNVAPVLAAVDETVTATVTFCDPDIDQPLNVTTDWGDGNVDVLLVDAAACPQEEDQSHTYAEAGVYTVTTTVTDAEQLSDAADQYAVIYDPNGGFVTGGGWIDSPMGAYAADESLIGKANFGFVSKYKKGANVPTGNTAFQFKVADLNFKSTSYDWLVIAGSKAKFKGEGAINEAGSFGFMLSAVDGDLNGGDDTFRIKIWDTANDDVVYDNQMGDTDDADATTVLGGGSIVVHKAK